MKILPCLLLLSLVCPVLADEEPNELRKLRQALEKSVAKEVERMNKIYLKELEEMKKNFMEKENLPGALAVDREIKAMLSQEPWKRSSLLDGVWVERNSHPKYGPAIRPIRDGKMVNYWQGSKLMSTCTIKAGVVEIKQDDGWWWKLKIAPNNPDIMEGTNKSGHKVTFTRLKW